MRTLQSSNRLGNVLGPVLMSAVLTVLLAGCTPQSDTETPEVPTVPEATSSEPTATEGTYADGTYAATGEYRSPAGSETVDVSLTLAGGVITDAMFKGNATVERSVQMQGQFSEGFKEQVVGKSIDTLSLGAVNGSSLTPIGFMDAVEKIKVEATAS